MSFYARRCAISGLRTSVSLGRVGWVERSETHQLRAEGRWVSLRSTYPCMGLWKSRGRHGRELLLQQAFQFLCSTEGVSSSRPRCFGAPRAAAVKAGRHCAGAADGIVSRPRLDGGEPGAPVDGRDDRSRDRRRDVVLDWAVNDACGEHRITLYPVRDESPVPQSFMHG